MGIFGNKFPFSACFLVAGAALCLCAASSCETAAPRDKATAIATAPYPGRKDVDQCAPYADALFDALKASNIEAWKITYMGGAFPGNYNHAMVVYKDAGSYWFVDNMFPYPTRTSGKKPREWVQDRDSGMVVITHVDYDMPLPLEPGATVVDLLNPKP